MPSSSYQAHAVPSLRIAARLRQPPADVTAMLCAGPESPIPDVRGEQTIVERVETAVVALVVAEVRDWNRIRGRVSR
jgi:hypothetical protein